MILYSSNANTDYLVERLGLDDINERINELELSHHDPIYPFTSTLWISHYLLEDQGVDEEKLVETLSDMSDADYRKQSIDIFHNWQDQPLTNEEKVEGLEVLSMDVQRVWSDRLPKASASDYIQIMQKLNGKNHYSEQVHEYLDPVLEQMMNHPSFADVEHAGSKGGSTAFVFTMAMYGTDSEGNKMEVVFLANDLDLQQFNRIANNMGEFQIKLLTDEEFHKEVQTELQP